ncbi:hypothetical protein [Ralstonia phage RP31]|uniref:Uncharacterized protein n=2 Tax=Ripduovirus RP12 TaxID=2560700 RepID=A0A1L7N0V3_9CAUD|nr:hypothetical protein FDH28_gp121 [Ralstonia phage RP12]BAW19095.1 hypothetical protein [Ralstonia phage RP12]BAW19381.1 hypothetical protein [Ralstonia phage RP31]
MSRTYRQNPSQPLDYRIDVRYDYGDWYFDEMYWIPLTAGGWREAKRQLSKTDYADLRKKLGDCFTKEYRRAGIPKWYRREYEKEHRHHTARELHRYTRNPDYEVMAKVRPDGAGYWYW